MSDKDYIKELFSDKLGNYEAPVSPDLWAGVASQIGATGATVVGAGMSVITKWIIGVSIASAVVISTVLIVNMDEETPVVQEEIAQVDTAAEEAVVSESTPEVPTLTVLSDQEELPVPETSETQEPLFVAPLEVQPLTNTHPEQEGTRVPETTTKTQIPPKTTPAEEQPETITAEPSEKDPVITKDEEIPEIPAEELNEVDKHYRIGELPNIFSPNGDGINDLFMIDSENLTEFTITIISDQNEVVYQSQDPNFSWDGTGLNGLPVAEGRYVYFITAREFMGDKPKRYSPLTIKRTR